MRNIKTVVSTGCFFLCLGGWVYSGQLKADDQVTQATLLNAAVAQAATPEVPAPAPATQAAPRGTDLSTPEVKVDVSGKVERLRLNDTDVSSALHLISEQFKKNIIASKNVKGTVTVDLYNVTFNEALDAMGKSNGFDYIEKGNFVYVYTVEEISDIRKRDRKAVNQIFRLKYINAKEASSLIKPLLSSTGQQVASSNALSGLATGNTDNGGTDLATSDTLVISDYPENIAEVTAALKEIDVRPKQVLIEATILNADLHDKNAMGIDMVSLSGLNFSDIGSVISPLSGSATTGSSSGGTTSASNVATPGQVAGTLIPGVSGKQFDGGTNFAKDVPSGGLSLGFMSNHISVFLRALETVADANVVANPKILALNKQKGVVHIGQRIGYKTTSTTQTATQETVQFLDVGTTLVFRPYIADDGWIRMEIHPEISDGHLDSGVPQTNETQVTSNIMIRDGRTVVIGGLFNESTASSKGQVPVLGNIPILGVPFRSQNDDNHRQETIVMITPHVINDDTSLYEESIKEGEDITRMMLGNRAGMMPWGRDRIAQLWYAKAQEEVSAGNKEKALMYLDWSLNTNPRLIEAIRLRDQLTNKKMDEAKGSTVIDLVKHTLQGDAATTPDKGGAGVYPPKANSADNK